MAEELVDTFVKIATGVALGVTILGPPLAMFVRRMRAAFLGKEEEAERLRAQRDALVDGHAEAIDELPEGQRKTVRAALKRAQIDAGVQSDLAPLVEKAKAALEERKHTPPPPGNPIGGPP